jgi:hypothetical protein
MMAAVARHLANHSNDQHDNVTSRDSDTLAITGVTTMSNMTAMVTT